MSSTHKPIDYPKLFEESKICDAYHAVSATVLGRLLEICEKEKDLVRESALSFDEILRYDGEYELLNGHAKKSAGKASAGGVRHAEQYIFKKCYGKSDWGELTTVERRKFRHRLKTFLGEKDAPSLALVDHIKHHFDESYTEGASSSITTIIEDMVTPGIPDTVIKKMQMQRSPPAPDDNTKPGIHIKESNWQTRLGYAAAGTAMLLLPDILLAEKEAPVGEKKQQRSPSQIMFRKVLRTTLGVAGFIVGGYFLAHATMGTKISWGERTNNSTANNQSKQMAATTTR